VQRRELRSFVVVILRQRVDVTTPNEHANF